MHQKHKWVVVGDETERIARIVSGDKRAFDELVRHYYGLVYSLAHKLLSDDDDAREIAQDTFVKVHCALDGFRGEASLKTWIMRIAMRLSLNRRRDRSRSTWHRLGLHGSETATHASTPAHQTPEGEYISREVRAHVRAQIDGLPEPLRQVLILNSFEDLSYEEIAQILDLPIGTVSSRLHAARKKLLHQFEKSDLL